MRKKVKKYVYLLCNGCIYEVEIPVGVTDIESWLHTNSETLRVDLSNSQWMESNCKLGIIELPRLDVDGNHKGPKVLCVTGGIGCGKSYMAKEINRLCGYPIYSSDDRAKELYRENKDLINSLTDLLGNTILDSSGEINRKEMAKIIFNDKNMLQKVENLVHPFVKEDFVKWKMENKDQRFVIYESAIVLERDNDIKEMMDYILVVKADMDLRLKRLQKRDGADMENIMSRINNQWTDEQREEYADFVIKSGEDTVSNFSQLTWILAQLC